MSSGQPLDPDLESRIEQLCDRSGVDLTAEMNALVADHPEQAESIREFFADHRRAHEQEARAAERSEDQEPRFGRYRVLERLGAGGMGTVYRAEDATLGRTVALKVLRPHYLHDGAIRQRFEREVRAASRLDHPNICSVFEVGEFDGEPFMTMQLIEGESLAEWLARARPSHESRSAGSSATQNRETILRNVKLIEDAARAIHVAHEAGLVHRDLKPGNLMLTSTGEVMVLDFGLVRDEAEDQPTLTLSGELLGTPRYMAPEQVAPQGRSIDRRTDVYALGVTLYELLTLEPPFAGETRAELFDAIRRADPTAARRRNRAIPPDLEIVIQRAMDPDPERRYLTAEALAEDLRRARAFEPIAARRTSAGLRLLRWCRRNRVAAVGLSSLALGLAATAWLASGWHAALGRERNAHAEIAEARASERAQEAARHFDAATAAVARGDHAAALIAFRHARSNGYEDDIAVSLGIIDSNEAISQVGESAELLTTLAKQSDRELGRHAARVRLLQGYSEFTLDNATGRALIERALELDAAETPPVLAVADREFARAMLAPDRAELIRGLENVIGADPRHCLGLMQLGLARLAAGQPEQTLEITARMRLLVPSSWNHVGLEASALAILGRTDEARACLADADQIPDELRIAFSLVVDIFEGTHADTEQNIGRRVAPNSQPASSFAGLKWAAIIGKVLQLQAIARDLGEADATYRMRVPPQVWRPYASIIPMLPRIMFAGGLKKVAAATERRHAEGESLKSAGLYLVVARSYLATQDTEPVTSYRGYLAMLERGRRSGGFGWGMPTMQRLFAYDVCAALIALIGTESDPIENRAAQLTTELDAAIRLPGISEGEFAHYCDFSYAASNTAIAFDGVIERWKAAHPGSPRPWIVQAQARLEQGARKLARNYCQRALELAPEHPEARELLERCR